MENILAIVEWYLHAHACQGEIPRCNSNIRCFRQLGLWCLLAECMVPVTLGTAKVQIAIKELIPIIVAAAIWGKHWKGYSLQCQCDNQAVVAVLNTRTSKEPQLMQLLRCLFFFEACWDFSLYGSYLPGIQNDLADALSRNRLSLFLSKVPQANAAPTPIPLTLRDLLLYAKPDWLSRSWTQLFDTILRSV